MDIAACVTVFQRVDKLNTLLHSVDPDFISKVYIADDGNWSELRDDVYGQSFNFDLEVFHLEYDSGLGAGRNRVVQECDEDFLLLMDCDMQMPANTHVLLEQLESEPNLGGVCGVLAEDDRVFSSGCLDIYEDNGVCKLEIRDNKRVKELANYPFIEFDMISNAALFRQECLEEYSWDPEYTIGREHADFYVGHMRKSDWKFGLCPAVHFRHNPGGSDNYLSHRWSNDKYRAAEKYFLRKWGFTSYDQVDYNWIDTYDARFNQHSPPGIMKRAIYKYNEYGLINLLRSSVRFLSKNIG